jgi:hypothetical protein
MARHPPCFSWRAAGTGGLLPQRHPCSIQARHLLWSELEQRARRHPWRGTSATSPPAAMALFPVLQRPSSLPFSVHGEQELFPPMASSFPAHGATPLLSFFFHLAVLSWPPAAMAWTPFFFLAQQQAPPWQAPRQASPMAPAAGISSPSPWRPENSSSAPLLFFPVVAFLRRAASRSMPWPDLPPPWMPLAVPCA